MFKDFIIKSNFGFSIFLSILLFIGAVKRFQKINELDSNSTELNNGNWDFKSEINQKNNNKTKKVGDTSIEFLSDKNLYENYLYHYSAKFPEDWKVTYGLGKSSNVLGISETVGLNINVQVTENPWLGAEKFDSSLDFTSKNQLRVNNDLIKYFFSDKEFFKIFRQSYEISVSENDVGLEELKVTNIEPVKYKNRRFIKFEHTGILSNPEYKIPVIRDEYLTFNRKNQYRISFEYLDSERMQPPKDIIDSFLMSFYIDEIDL